MKIKYWDTMAREIYQNIFFQFWLAILNYNVVNQVQFSPVLINNWWKVNDVISLLKVMSNSFLPSFLWNLLGIWDIGLRNCKYLKNDKC